MIVGVFDRSYIDVVTNPLAHIYEIFFSTSVVYNIQLLTLDTWSTSGSQLALLLLTQANYFCEYMYGCRSVIPSHHNY